MTVRVRQLTDVAVPTIYAEQAYGLALTAGTGNCWVTYSDTRGLWQVALIMTPIAGGGYEACNPYGYAGIFADRSLSDHQISLFWSETLAALNSDGVVSLFLRFPSFAYSGVDVSRFAGLKRLTTVITSKTVEIRTGVGTDIWFGMEGRARTAVRKAKKLGMVAEVCTVTHANMESVATFRALYEATMSRIGASQHHLYKDDYYAHLITGLGARVRVLNVAEKSGRPAASALLLTDRDVVHYHLSGSDPSAARDGANNLLIWTILEWASGHGYSSVHLGGGLAADDSLFRFKRSFGGVERNFSVGRVIVNPNLYEKLTTVRAAQLNISPADLKASTYFPVFRAEI